MTKIKNKTHEDNYFTNMLGLYIDKIQEKQISKDIWGYRTGYEEYDSLMNGLHNSELTVIAARHSIGKTSFVLNVAYNISSISEIPVLYISYDMSMEAILERLVSSQSGIASEAIKKKVLNQKEWDSLVETINKLHELFQSNKFQIIPSCNLYYKDLFDTIRNFKKEHENGVVIVDYFQLVKLNKDEETRYIELTGLAAAFKNLTMELNLPIILVSQVSKKCDERINKRPRLSDLSECDALAQHCDNLIFIYREDYYQEIDYETEEDETSAKSKGVAEFIVAKHKQGPRGSFKLLFQENISKFKNPIHYTDNF